MKPRVFSLILLAILLVASNSLLMAQTQFLKAGAERFKIPVRAPEFELKELGSGNLSLKSLAGKVVVLNFFEPG